MCVGVCVWGGVCVRERVTRRRERLKSVLLDRLAWHNWEWCLSRGARVGLHRHRRRGRVVSPRIRGFQTLPPALCTPAHVASPIGSEGLPRSRETSRAESSLRATGRKFVPRSSPLSPRRDRLFLPLSRPPAHTSYPHSRESSAERTQRCVFTNPVSLAFASFSSNPLYLSASLSRSLLATRSARGILSVDSSSPARLDRFLLYEGERECWWLMFGLDGISPSLVVCFVIGWGKDNRWTVVDRWIPFLRRWSFCDVLLQWFCINGR